MTGFEKDIQILLAGRRPRNAVSSESVGRAALSPPGVFPRPVIATPPAGGVAISRQSAAEYSFDDPRRAGRPLPAGEVIFCEEVPNPSGGLLLLLVRVGTKPSP